MTKRAVIWVFLVQLLFSITAYNQEEEIVIDFQSLKKNTRAYNEAMPEFSLLETRARDFRIYLAGETHGVGINPDLQYELLVYLHTNCNVRNLILEVPVSYGVYLDEFLATGDTSILMQTLYDGKQGSVFSSRETFRFYLRLLAYNRDQAKNAEINLLYIDVEHKPAFAYRCLRKLLMTGKDTCQALQRLADKLELWERSFLQDEATNRQRIEYLRDHFNPNVYRNCISNDACRNFEKVLENLYETFENKREQQLHSNFVKQAENCFDSNFFGQMGGLHVINKKRLLCRKTFAEKLNHARSSEFRKQVVSIMYVYQNCARINVPGRYTLGLIEPESFELITKQNDAKFNFIKVDASGHVLLEERKNYSYLLLIRDQEAMSPLQLND